MTRDHNDIYSIVERLRVLEEGLDKNQRSVNQLGATFRPKTVAVLTAKTDPKNPMAGKLVGSDESKKQPGSVLEADVSEDVLEKVKSSFVDYLKSIEDKYKDSNLKDKTTTDTDLKSKDKKDRDLKVKEKPVAEDPNDSEHEDDQDDQSDLPSDYAYQRGESPYDQPEPQTEQSELGSALSGVIPAQQPEGEPGVSMKESTAIKTINNECGLWEMHGDEQQGFEIRRGDRSMPARFKTLDEAEMAIEMFMARRRKKNEVQDYLDEE